MKRRCKKLMTLMLSAMLAVQMPLASVSAAVTDAEPGMAAMTDTESMVQAPGVSENEMTGIQISQSELLLNYIYIENIAQENEDGTNIVASFGEGEEDILHVRLSVVNTQTNDSYEIPSCERTGDAYQFSTAGLGLVKGLYRVEAIFFEREGSQEQITITNIPGMEDVVFGVMTEPDFSGQEIIPLESLGDEAAADNALSVEQLSVDGELEEKVRVDIRDLDSATSSLADRLIRAKAGEDELAVERATDTQAGFVKIFLDPGHDATHAGARANGLYEETLNLKVAQYCRDYLLATYTNVEVKLCRETASCPYPGSDSAADNRARVADAASWGADAYVSIHFNSAAASATGAMVYYPNTSYNADVSSKGSVLATKILEQLVKLGLPNKGIHIRNSESGDRYDDGSLMDYYAVIRAAKNAGIPGIIVEHAFLTNASDAAFLKSEDNIKKIGVADALGIAAAYNLSTEPVEYYAKSIEVTDIDGVNGSFQLTVTGAKPVAYIDAVQFEVWPASDTTKKYVYTAAADAQTKGTYRATGGVGNHGNVTGQYKVVAYACDPLGRRAKLGNTTFTITQAQAEPGTCQLLVKKTSDQKKVTLSLKGNEGAAQVTFKVSAIRGTDGRKVSKNYTAAKSGNVFQATVLPKDFGATGQYTVAVYSKNYYGVNKKILTQTFEIEPPFLKSVSVKNVNYDKGTFQLRANSIGSLSGVKKVQFQVKSLEGKKVTKIYLPALKGNYYASNIDLKDFGYQLGKYEFGVIVTDGNDAQTQIATEEYVFELPDTEVTAKVKANETKLVLSAKNLGIGVNIKGVRFKVTRKGGLFKTKYYDAKYTGGAYTVNVKVTDLSMEGTYKIQAYTKGANGKFTKAGKLVKAVISDIEGGVVSTKAKSDSANYFFVDSISANSPVTKVEVRAWPVAKTSAKATYIAQQLSNGRFRALIDQKKHQGLGGNYKYEVTVTLKNGVTKKLLAGKFSMGEDSGQTDDSDQPFVTAEGYHTITGPNGVTVDQMVSYYLAHTSYPAFYKGSDAPNLKKFCTIYYEECQAENIRVEVAFVQAMKETNFLRYTGDVDISQYNFAGIGATGGGVKGNSFSSVAVGVRAQVQHLKAYANNEPLNKPCVDPRFSYVSRGNSPYVEWLGIPDNPNGKGWAAAQNYGSSILTMIELLKSY